MPIPDSIHEVKKHLRKYHRPNEPIPEKSKDRVLTLIARSIRNNLGLPKGRCDTCGNQSDRLVPVQSKVCRGCFNIFNKKSGYNKILKNELLDNFHCDWCLGRTFTPISVNPFVCLNCTTKVGNRHSVGMKEVRRKTMQSLIRRGY